MLFESEASNENCAPPGASKRFDGYAKIQHLFRLVRKFHHPIVVFVGGSSSWPDMRRTQLEETVRLASHILSQWCLDVPIILVVLSRNVSVNVLGVWLADKVLAFEDACFSMAMVDSVETHLVSIGARSLRDHGVIDGTIDTFNGRGHDSPAGMPMLGQMSVLLNRTLKELASLSSTELLRKRREKVELIARLASNNTQAISSSHDVMAGPSLRVAGAEVSVPSMNRRTSECFINDAESLRIDVSTPLGHRELGVGAVVASRVKGATR